MQREEHYFRTINNNPYSMPDKMPPRASFGHETERMAGRRQEKSAYSNANAYLTGVLS